MGMITAGVLAGCSGSDGSGLVQGMLPLCYGPGPGMNLTPTVVVEVRGSAGLVRRETFTADEQDRHYQLRLPAGEYQLTAVGASDMSVNVHEGTTTYADFPQRGCL